MHSSFFLTGKYCLEVKKVWYSRYEQAIFNIIRKSFYICKEYCPVDVQGCYWPYAV